MKYSPIHWMFCLDHGKVGVPFFKLFCRGKERHVKHVNLYCAMHAVGPMVLAIAVMLLASFQLSHIENKYVYTKHVPGLLQIVGVIVVDVCLRIYAWYQIFGLAYGNAQAVQKRAFDIKVEPLDISDKGEYLELGTGWRKMKVAFTVTIGEGRLARPRIEWVEFAVNQQEVRTITLEASDPLIAVYANAHGIGISGWQ